MVQNRVEVAAPSGSEWPDASRRTAWCRPADAVEDPRAQHDAKCAVNSPSAQHMNRKGVKGATAHVASCAVRGGERKQACRK